MDDAYVYEMKCNLVEAKHLGCYTNPAPPSGSQSSHLWYNSGVTGPDSAASSRATLYQEVQEF